MNHHNSFFVFLLKAAIILIINHGKWGASRSWTSHSIGAISWSDLQLVLWMGLMMRTTSPSRVIAGKFNLTSTLASAFSPDRITWEIFINPTIHCPHDFCRSSLDDMILAYCLAVSKLILRQYDSGMVPCHVETDFEAATWPKAGRRYFMYDKYASFLL